MLYVRTLHFDFGVEQACSAATRVTSSLAVPRLLLPPAVVLFFFWLRGGSLPGVAAGGSVVLHGPPAPSSLCTSSFLRSTSFLRSSTGAVGRVSRLRRVSSTGISHQTPSLMCIRSAESRPSGAPGCVFLGAMFGIFKSSISKVDNVLRKNLTDRS